MSSITLKSLLLGVVLSATSPSFAVILKYGQSVPARAQSNSVDGIHLTTSRVPFMTASFGGILTSSVYQDDRSNPFGGLTFTYQLETFAESRTPIRRMTLDGFISYLVDTSFEANSNTLAPSIVDRHVAGNVVGFSFSSPNLQSRGLANGVRSSLVVIRTDALGYTYRIATVSNGAVAAVNAIGPAGRPTVRSAVSVVPEPVSLGGVVLASVAVVAVRRRSAS